MEAETSLKTPSIPVLLPGEKGVTCTEKRWFDTDEIKSVFLNSSSLAFSFHCCFCRLELLGRFLLSFLVLEEGFLGGEEGFWVADETGRKLES